MEINVTKENGKLVLTPFGRIDSITSEEFVGKIEENMDDSITELVVEMSNVDFVSSKGIRIFLLWHRNMESKGKFVLKNINNSVREVLRMSALLNVLNIE